MQVAGSLSVLATLPQVFELVTCARSFLEHETLGRSLARKSRCVQDESGAMRSTLAVRGHAYDWGRARLCAAAPAHHFVVQNIEVQVSAT